MATFFPVTYQLGAPVGPNQTNASDDVRLLKAMFKALRESSPAFASHTPALDDAGQFSSALGTHISHFQQNHGGGQLVVDGIVHPMRTGRLADLRSTFRSGVGSTLHVLNAFCFHNAPQRHVSIAQRLGLASMLGRP